MHPSWLWAELPFFFLTKSTFYYSPMMVSLCCRCRGLDLGPYCAQGSPTNSAVYDLYAVVNHIGGCFGGHYTAFCQEESDDLDEDDGGELLSLSGNLGGC